MPGPLVCDVAGLSLSDEEIRRVRHPLVGMVILFSRNYRDPEQLSELCRELRGADPDLLISVDHEGGRVQRFREGFSAIPAARRFAPAAAEGLAERAAAARAAGYVLAAELRARGVDFSFAPVLDLDWGRCQVIGERAFHSDPRVVATLAGAFIAGLGEAGMASCGKHFPGHGWPTGDSHVELPVDERPAETIIARDALPYRLLARELASVMTAHVVYPALDHLPATFSERVIGSLLRQGCGFDGLVFSDDLSMRGASETGDILARARAALRAGCDALIVCNAPGDVDVLLDGLDWRPTPGFERRWHRLRPRGPAPGWEELRREDRYQRARRHMIAGPTGAGGDRA